MSLFNICDKNPNNDTGGGGTLTSGETRSEDSKGPYVVFPATETASNISPHAVLSYDDVIAIYKALTAQAEEPEVIDIPDEDVEEIPAV